METTDITVTTITGHNSKVACTPFQKRGVEVKLNNGVARIAQKVALSALTVIYGNGKDIHPGDVVYVRGDAVASWGKDEVDVEGQTLVMVAPDSILLVKRTFSGGIQSPRWTENEKAAQGLFPT